jgi:hypothetical protein
MREIILRNGEIVCCDDSDYATLSSCDWSKVSRYAAFKRSGKYVFMHRMVLGLSVDDVREVDHVDGNGLNNCRSNLRVCSHSENMKNRPIHKNNKSGFKGVYRDAGARSVPGREWRAQIRVDGKKINLGAFPCPEVAHAAYVSAAQKYHGEFSRHV